MVLSVQYMRAIAALLVLIGHSAWKGEQYSSNPLEWFHVGGVGVDLFFIISGFIMCYTTYRKEIDFGRFMKARLTRIFPLYWVLTTVALFVFILFPGKVNSSGGTTSIIHSYTLFPTEAKYLINNGWTLSYELLFYLIFGLGLIFSGRLKIVVPGIIILSLVAVGQLLGSPQYILTFLTSPLLIEFVFGISVFLVLRKIKLNAGFAIGFIAISILLLISVNMSGGAQLGAKIRVVDYGMPALLFFVGMLSLEPFFKKNDATLISKVFYGIGNSSYSLYLLHPFVLSFSAIALQKIGVNKMGYPFVTLLVISSVLAGHLCYLLLEKPLLLMFKKAAWRGEKTLKL